MGFDENVEMIRLAFYQVLISSGPFLGAALAIGLIIGIVQAATSIQEMTLVFVPKIIFIFLALVLTLPFMIKNVVSFGEMIFDTIIALP